MVNNVMHALRSECFLRGDIELPEWIEGEGPFPADEEITTKSGILHIPSLAAGEPSCLPPTPALLTTNALPYAFDPQAECPTWIAFLESIWGDDQQAIDTFGEWFGYCLVPDTRQHKLLMLIGPARSGKGTIARVMRGLIGEKNLASPTLASLDSRFGLWPLLGKLVAVVADARLSARNDSIQIVERLLSITGEDPQDVERKNLPILTGIRLPVRFMIMTNELPNVRDTSGALMTRLILLSMPRSFHGQEDRTVSDRLLQELPGIPNWAIHGWQRLTQRGGFLQPESSQELINDLHDLASPIRAFLKDECEIGAEFCVAISALYERWCDWSARHGRERPGNAPYRPRRGAEPARWPPPRGPRRGQLAAIPSPHSDGCAAGASPLFGSAPRARRPGSSSLAPQVKMSRSRQIVWLMYLRLCPCLIRLSRYALQLAR
ncbi:MAG: DNA primase family protein, partial [bacterium]